MTWPRTLCLVELSHLENIYIFLLTFTHSVELVNVSRRFVAFVVPQDMIYF